MSTRLLLLAPLLAACGAAQATLPPPIVLEVDDDSLRLVLLGDSGASGTDGGAACDPNTLASPIPPACRTRLLASVRSEAPDAVLDLGDLVYESGPLCRDGLGEEQRALLEERVGSIQTATEAPLLLVLGNHDVHQSRVGHEDAEACYRLYAAERADVFLPERNYVVEAGPATLLALDTNRTLSDELAARLRAAAEARATPWTLFAGHHVWTCYDDKEPEHEGPSFSDAIGLRPDLWLNGHAHFLQFGVYDGVGAVTSGSAGKLRWSKDCEGEACGDPGRLFGARRYGYAVLDVTPEQVVVTFKDVTGATLYEWTRAAPAP